MSNVTAPRVLLAPPTKPAPPAAEVMVRVARKYGVSPFRQFGQMLRIWSGKHRVQFHEYFAAGIYREDLSAEEKRQFVGMKGSFYLNTRLSPLALTALRPFVRDKVFYDSMLRQLGFNTPRTQAVAAQRRRYGALPTLSDVAQIEAFLLDTARYPLFVKPEEGHGSVGSALITHLDRATRELVLGNGTRIDLRDFALEVMEDYAEGLLFQDAVQQHPELVEMAGQAVGTIRVVTVIAEESPQVLYTLWKVPSPDAMSDNYWQKGSMLADIDPTSGTIRQCRRGTGPDQEIIETHPVSGLPFNGMQIPHWEEVRHMTRDAHALMPDFGVFGFDVAITQDGPVIIECNANPHHMLYQFATGRGMLNADHAPTLDKVAERARTLREARKKAYRAKLKA